MEEKKEYNVYQKLALVQSEIKANKSRYNTFGKYNYRSCEDIQEAIKPFLLKYNCSIILTDNITQIGDRYYVKATAIFMSTENLEDNIVVSAYAREDEKKTGMDLSQLTGACSSYARKYALNGVFLLDDTKDADSDEANNDKKDDKKPKTESNGLEWLNKGKGDWDLVVKAIKEGKRTVADIKKKFNISGAVEKELSELEKQTKK